MENLGLMWSKVNSELLSIMLDEASGLLTGEEFFSKDSHWATQFN